MATLYLDKNQTDKAIDELKRLQAVNPQSKNDPSPPRVCI